ncbi:MAG: DNA polymerase Y family protein, partial [Pseudomonadota bacterium]
EHGLTARAAMADTKGAAWALAHHGRQQIAPPGRTRQAIADLPTTALRLPIETTEALAKTGLTTIEPLTRMPRGALARRFGIDCMRRLDQALGTEPEPVAPARAQPVFSVRLTLPDPIGLTKDVMAGLDRLLERLCRDLERHQMGARTLRLTARRVDCVSESAEISLARPGRDPMRLRDLFIPKVDAMDAGFGIDALHLLATVTEPLKPTQLTQAHRETEAAKLADLLSRIGNRVGFENVLRFLPAESHIPERAFTIAAAAHSDAEPWPDQGRPPRPITLFRPEPLGQPPGTPPARFQWRGRTYTTEDAQGPERLAPEWWWDDPDWRTGPRDYWRVQTAEGPRLWLFHTPAHPAWYAQGAFA